MGSAQVDVELKDFKNIFSLEGKVAVVTGGSRGLGLNAASGSVLTCHSPESQADIPTTASSKLAAPKYT
jgi:hypothetical protein